MKTKICLPTLRTVRFEVKIRNLFTGLGSFHGFHLSFSSPPHEDSATCLSLVHAISRPKTPKPELHSKRDKFKQGCYPSSRTCSPRLVIIQGSSTDGDGDYGDQRAFRWVFLVSKSPSHSKSVRSTLGNVYRTHAHSFPKSPKRLAHRNTEPKQRRCHAISATCSQRLSRSIAPL